MKTCIDCKLTEKETKFPKSGGNRCTKCRYVRYKDKLRKYCRDRYREDITYADRERAKGRKIMKKRRESGKDKEYMTKSIRMWLYTKTRGAKTNSKKRGLEYSITLDHLCNLWKLQNEKCALSGLQMSHAFHCPFSASIDRIDPNLGYTKSNTQLVCQAINLAKNRMSNDSMKEFINALRTNP
jgi:hypothetical protein